MDLWSFRVFFRCTFVACHVVSPAWMSTRKTLDTEGTPRATAMPEAPEKDTQGDAAIPWCDDCGAEIFLISRNIMITITWLGSNMFFEKKCKRFRSGVFFSFSCISLMFVGCFYMNLAISRFNSPWPWAAFDGATALDHWTTSSHVQEVHPSHVAKHHWIWILLMFFFGL